MQTMFRSLAAGLVIFGAAATSQAQADTVTAVPFAFTVGSTELPRDSYTISRVSGHMNAFLIRGLRGSTIVMSQPDGPSATDPSPRLVFHRYGDRYFLREVRLAGNTGFSLPKSRAETSAEEKVAKRSAPEVIVLTARPQ
jgi:hypothetical protein